MVLGVLIMANNEENSIEKGHLGKFVEKSQQDSIDLSKLPLEELESRLSSSSAGLSKIEVQKRIAQYGYNELPEKKANPLLKFLSYFWGPIPIMIIIAAVLSGILQHWPDLGVIVALLVLNAVVGFREEYQAGNVIAALKKKLAVQAKVKRDGTWTSIPARELVPGDVIRLRIGEIVPADARLFDGDPVEVDQSALTGESLPVERKPGEAVYSGSIIRRGEIEALAYATGGSTFYGKTAELVRTTETHSHLQRAVVKIANYLIYIALALRYFDLNRVPFTARPASGCTPICAGSYYCRCACSYASGIVGNHGVGGPGAGFKAGNCYPAIGHRGVGRCRCSLLRQNRYPNPKQIDDGRPFHPG